MPRLLLSTLDYQEGKVSPLRGFNGYVLVYQGKINSFTDFEIGENGSNQCVYAGEVIQKEDIIINGMPAKKFICYGVPTMVEPTNKDLLLVYEVYSFSNNNILEIKFFSPGGANKSEDIKLFDNIVNNFKFIN